MNELSEYEAIVYDLDGTLVHLDVDWTAVAGDVATTFAGAGIEVLDDDLWSLRERAAEADLTDEVEEIIAEHEREGARTSRRLALADHAAEDGRALGVCSLNCEEACSIALDTHGIRESFAAIVGRDTVDVAKPDPEPLLATVDRVDSTPEESAFVGDTDRDALTAERAGMDFYYVSDLV
ncbi:HAD family hydrolase [Natronorarus salvus]|uniref:HAD family hydrolase n=1 Tax=Natronorarus salvus TaxID=3117733 RepID=UPI002F265D43